MPLKKEFTVEREGKTFVLYAGLLDMAHEAGLKAITTTLVQIPNEMNGNVAIVHAIVEIENGTFTGLGDASPTNVTRMMAPHMIRMAETRAKARALRDAVNVGVTALEELGDDHGVDLDDDLPQEIHEAAYPRRSAPAAGGTVRVTGQAQTATRPAATSAGPMAPQHPSGAAATPKQLETIARMARAAGKSVDTDGLTRTQASEIISGLIGEMGERRAE